MTSRTRQSSEKRLQSAEIGKISTWGRVLCISAGHISSGHILDASLMRKYRSDWEKMDGMRRAPLHEDVFGFLIHLIG